MDTIAAIATGTATTAIGIVRVSGENCFEICDRMFRPADGTPLSAHEPRKMIYGTVLDKNGTLIDQGMAVRFPAPHSYTGENGVEFDCHGSPVVLRELLSALFAAGARQAKAGEFTKRAFLNGRMDLTQAEAVADLIDSETPAAARNAAAQLNGALRRPLQTVQNALLDITSRFYAVVDYPDEDIEDVKPAAIAQALQTSEVTLTRLLSTCERGKLLKSGIRTAIIGKPNAGKSSLLNALAGYDRTIVTDVPGTTRDTVEEPVLCGNVLLRLIDTAGIHKTSDAVEKLGVQRSRAALNSADLALAVVDSSQFSTLENQEIFTLAAQCKKWILVCSKKDLWKTQAHPAYEMKKTARRPDAVVSVSSVTGEGIADLGKKISALFPSREENGDSLLTNARQEDAVFRARESVRRAAAALSAGLTPDAILTDAEEALNALGELTGRTARDSIVETIFSRFCVGK